MSNYNIYSINFAVSFDIPFQSQTSILEQYLKDSVDILGYWNHIPLHYLVKSQANAQQLAAKFGAFFPSNHFLIARLDPTDINGMLPKAAWEWFHSEPTPRNPLLPHWAMPSLLSSAKSDK